MKMVSSFYILLKDYFSLLTNDFKLLHIIKIECDIKILSFHCFILLKTLIHCSEMALSYCILLKQVVIMKYQSFIVIKRIVYGYENFHIVEIHISLLRNDFILLHIIGKSCNNEIYWGSNNPNSY
jgi:hypothetical protein